jgi:hypothetical protein
MGVKCLSECPSCQRHVRCGERACPFCGATVRSFLRVLEYRLLTRLTRSQALSLGAAMTAAGFATNCDDLGPQAVPVYGAPCNPPSCVVPQAGSAGGAGKSGTAGAGGNGGTAGVQGFGGKAGQAPVGGAPAAGEGGLSGDGGVTNEGGAGGTPGLEGGAGGESQGGVGGEGGAS